MRSDIHAASAAEVGSIAHISGEAAAHTAGTAHHGLRYLADLFAVYDYGTAVEFGSAVIVEGRHLSCYIYGTAVYDYPAIGIDSVGISRTCFNSGVSAVELDADLAGCALGGCIYTVIGSVYIYSSVIYLYIGGLNALGAVYIEGPAVYLDIGRALYSVTACIYPEAAACDIDIALGVVIVVLAVQTVLVGLDGEVTAADTYGVVVKTRVLSLTMPTLQT